MIGITPFTSATKASQRIDPWTYLIENKRILVLRGAIVPEVPTSISGMVVPHMNVGALMDTMIALDVLEVKPIKLIIDSEGGAAADGLALFDTMQSLRSPVYTIGRGTCASMAAILLVSGAPGRRYAFPNCSLMLHMARGAASGDRKEREAREKNLREYEERIADIIRRHCAKSQSTDEILREWFEESELWMFAEKALEYGLIDKVITPEVYREEIVGEN